MSAESKGPPRIDTTRIFARHPYAREILRRLEGAGHDAVLIGGVVRDLLLAQLEGREWQPKDIDIATSARPEEIKEIFKDWRAVEVGEAFGVLRLVAPDGQGYEVATFRVESEYDGRWPGRVALVRDLEGDIRRRDLTINGLAAREDGRVIDLVGGVEDLKRRIIRAIGDPDERFREDYLRMLRAIRVACQLGGRLDPETAAAIRRNSEKILKISWERIRDELWRVLETEHTARGVRLLEEHGLLERILPELEKAKGVKQPEKYHPEGDVYTHTLLALEVADRLKFGPLVKLAVLLHDIGKPRALKKNEGENMAGHEVIGERMAGEICRRLRLSNEQTGTVKYLVQQHMRVAKLPEMARARQIRLIKEGEDYERDFADFRRRFPLFSQLLQVLIADCEASVHRSSGWLPVFQAAVELLPEIKRLEELEAARKLLDGHDILELGVEEGPEVGR
ncbi:MAG: CCA tRNA nucleotidyltransferase, partial [Candidatus Bipolaricaulia bacterium]